MMPTVNLKPFFPNWLVSKKSMKSSEAHSLRCQSAALKALKLAQRGLYPNSKALYFVRANYRFHVWHSILISSRIGPIRFLRLWLLLFASIADDTTQDIVYESEERLVNDLWGRFASHRNTTSTTSAPDTCTTRTSPA